jgi:hypothetical protein
MAARDPGARFPAQGLERLGGGSFELSSAWATDDVLVLLGHRDCKTTRQVIPVVDRIHRRRTRGRCLLVLQDDRETARALAAALGLDLPVLIEADPYPLALALALEAVPTLFFVERGGGIAGRSVGFSRADLERFAGSLGVPPPLFAPDEKVPAFRPG